MYCDIFLHYANSGRKITPGLINVVKNNYQKSIIYLDHLQVPIEIFNIIISFLDDEDRISMAFVSRALYLTIDLKDSYKSYKLYIQNLDYITNGGSLKEIVNQTPKICLKAIKRDSDELQYVKNQTEQLCLEAVRQDGYALQYVKNQTEQLCLEAVKQNGYALKYVKNQTEQICLEAVKQNSLALLCVENRTEQICLEAVRENSYMHEYVQNQIAHSRRVV